ncbi:MAG: TMEM175 family protein [Oceanicaulis sp.]
MSRTAPATRHPLLRGEPHFRWRSPEVSRVENLSDIVFALVLTLAAAQTIPASFADLTNLWRDALALTACFALILTIWHTHHVFFRRYDLQDGYTVFLNAVLLLLVLIFVYPLRFMADFVLTYFTGGFETQDQIEAVLTVGQVKQLYVIFAIFYIGVQIVFALLYAHALKRGAVIDLNEAERSWTRYEIEVAIGIIAINVLVIASAYALPADIGAMSGGLYALIGLVTWGFGRNAAGRAERASASP